jgi:N-acyl-D-aspartate/D-glutamate deacylase
MTNWSAFSGELTLNKWKWNSIEEYLDTIKLRNFPTKIETFVGHNMISINFMGYDKRKPKHFEAK